MFTYRFSGILRTIVSSLGTFLSDRLICANYKSTAINEDKVRHGVRTRKKQEKCTRRGVLFIAHGVDKTYSMEYAESSGHFDWATARVRRCDQIHILAKRVYGGAKDSEGGR